mgnify:CR=1 FL=1
MLTQINPIGLLRKHQNQLDVDKWSRVMDVIFLGVFDIYENTLDTSSEIEQVIWRQYEN